MICRAMTKLLLIISKYIHTVFFQWWGMGGGGGEGGESISLQRHQNQCLHFVDSLDSVFDDFWSPCPSVQPEPDLSARIKVVNFLSLVPVAAPGLPLLLPPEVSMTPRTDWPWGRLTMTTRPADRDLMATGWVNITDWWTNRIIQYLVRYFLLVASHWGY